MRQYNNHNESEYIRFFQSGEEKGFNFFFREYYAALCYFAFRITKNKEESEDIAGEAFIKLWERHAQFDNAASIKSFLYTTTRNTCLNRIRQQKKESERAKSMVQLTEESESAIIQKIIETELYREIFIALNSLPPKCRKIFRMLFF